MTQSSGKRTTSLSAVMFEQPDDLGGVGRRVGHRGPGRDAGDADKAILVHRSQLGRSSAGLIVLVATASALRDSLQGPASADRLVARAD